VRLTALPPGRPYWAYCATNSGLRSGPLVFETTGGLSSPSLDGNSIVTPL
jgi:hypothetical protein